MGLRGSAFRRCGVPVGSLPESSPSVCTSRWAPSSASTLPTGCSLAGCLARNETSTPPAFAGLGWPGVTRGWATCSTAPLMAWANAACQRCSEPNAAKISFTVQLPNSMLSIAAFSQHSVLDASSSRQMARYLALTICRLTGKGTLYLSVY